MRKAYRVKSESDFQHVFDQGRSVANRQFVIYWLKKAQQPHFRVGISVSKRLGNAVTRNHVKRKIRQAILECDQQQRLIHEVDFIVIARQPAVTMSVDECKKCLLHVLNLAQLIIQPERN